MSDHQPVRKRFEPAVYRGRYDLLRGQTPSQTLGPFFHQGLLRTRHAFQVEGLCSDERDIIHNALAGPGAEGQRLRIEGAVFDGLGAPIGDALVEVWQADAAGRFDHPLDPAAAKSDPHFAGFGRAATNEAGEFWFDTVKPGRVRGPGGRLQASHVSVIVGARGMARHAMTRIYFEGDPELSEDAVLAQVPEVRRHTLVARRVPSSEVARYRYDIHLQGDAETVFFDV
jgi:protocatechuate 3,4-dioxygenase alpha subunit